LSRAGRMTVSGDICVARVTPQLDLGFVKGIDDCRKGGVVQNRADLRGCGNWRTEWVSQLVVREGICY
jgi:hypothetical protein